MVNKLFEPVIAVIKSCTPRIFLPKYIVSVSRLFIECFIPVRLIYKQSLRLLVINDSRRFIISGFSPFT